MSNMHPTTARLLQFMDYVIANNIGDVTDMKTFFIAIGYSYNNIGGLKAGRHKLTIDHLQAASDKFGVDMNWVFGYSSQMLRKGTKPSAIDELKQAVARIEMELKKKP